MVDDLLRLGFLDVCGEVGLITVVEDGGVLVMVGIARYCWSVAVVTDWTFSCSTVAVFDEEGDETAGEALDMIVPS
jgi:hypothetical protein